MARKTIMRLGSDLAAELERKGFAPSTVKHYRETFKSFASYAASRGARHWSEGLVDGYLESRFGWARQSEKSPSQRATQVARGCLMLGFYESTGDVPLRIRGDQRPVPAAFRPYLELMVADDLSRGLSEETIRGRHDDVCDFLDYLDRENVNFPAELDAIALETFSEERHCAAPGAMQRILSSTRCFLRCMFAHGVTDRDYSPLVPKASRYPRKPVSKIWTSEEVKGLMEAIPRHDATGKRDFAIISLLAAYGMRDGDVTRLRMADIDWDDSSIRFVQHKNKVANVLPMTDQVGWALADWMANGRPKRAICPEVFTRLTAPFGPLSDVSSILDRRMASAGISKEKGVKSGPHSLRHSVASGMLASGAAVPVIASVLGDGLETASKVYIHADLEGLRRCALGGEL